MIDEIQIIKALPRDWLEYKALRLLELESDPEAFATSLEEAASLPDEKWRDHLETCIYLFAKISGELVGMVGVEAEKKEKLKHRAELRELYVIAEQRGKGVGRKLMEALFAELKRNTNVQKIVLYVTETQSSALKLYEQLGFRKVGILERDIKIGGKYYDEYIMEKFIDSEDGGDA